MKTLCRNTPDFVVKSRADGFAVFDKNQHFRFKATTRQAADDWIATQAKAKRDWSDVAGTHAAHTVGMGES